MPIKGLSERRRMPRLGKVRLGITVQEPGRKPYPKAVDYFVVEDVVAAVHGPKPTVLPIMFPIDDPGKIFPQDLKAYTQSGLFCKGDGERATRWVDGELKERTCPCEMLDDGRCKPLATLNFLLPAVPGIGVWQMNTSGKETITLLNSALESYARMFGGLRGIPFNLQIGPHQTQRWDEKKNQMVKTTIQVVTLTSDFTLQQIMQHRIAMGAPVDAMMLPEPDVPKLVTERAAEAGEHRPDDTVDALRETLWTSFFDAASGNAENAGKLARLSIRRHLKVEAAGLADLSSEDLTRLAEALREERGSDL